MQKQIPAYPADHAAFKKLASGREMKMKDLLHDIVEKMMKEQQG